MTSRYSSVNSALIIVHFLCPAKENEPKEKRSGGWPHCSPLVCSGVPCAPRQNRRALKTPRSTGDPLGGQAYGFAFLLGTFLWRSKEKYLARGGETQSPTNRVVKPPTGVEAGCRSAFQARLNVYRGCKPLLQRVETPAVMSFPGRNKKAPPLQAGLLGYRRVTDRLTSCRPCHPYRPCHPCQACRHHPPHPSALRQPWPRW